MARPGDSISEASSLPQGRRPAALLILAAALLACSFPPVDAGHLAWVALAPLLLAVDAAPGGAAAFRRGWLFGALFWGASVYWIGTTVVGWTGSLIGWIAWVILTAIEACWFGLFAAGARPIMKRSSGIPRVVGVAAAWTVVEWLRAQTALAMPWALLGYTQHRFLPLVQVAAAAGVWGVSFVVALGGAAVAETARRVARGERRPYAPIGIPAAASAVCCVAGAIVGTPPAAGTARIAVVQLNQPTWRTGGGSLAARGAAIVRLARRTADRRPALMVWPESAADDVARDAVERAPFAEAARITGAFQLVGSGFADRGGRVYNSAVLLDPHGRCVARYDKRHLVPFGEWTPLAGLLAPFDAIFHFPRPTTAGDTAVPLRAGSLRVGPLICYETVFPELTRGSSAAGAEVLANLTNDSWSGGTPVLRQHAAMTAMRSVETRRCTVVAGLTGITGWVDARGRMTALPPWREGVIVADVPRAAAGVQTPYVRFGDWFVAVCVALAALPCLPLRRVRPNA